jgi:hypothetical protein
MPLPSLHLAFRPLLINYFRGGGTSLIPPYHFVISFHAPNVSPRVFTSPKSPTHFDVPLHV